MALYSSLFGRKALFQNRRHAGAQLAQKVAELQLSAPVVVALLRGGVPVGAEVARALKAPLLALAVRKLGSPQQPEFAIGAIAPDGVAVFNSEAIARFQLDAQELVAILDREGQELARRSQKFQSCSSLSSLTGRNVVIVDDGLATGMTMQAAIKYLQRQQPQQLIVAVPVCDVDAVRMLGAPLNGLICLEQLVALGAVGKWYGDFSQVSDDEVLALLQQANRDLKVGESCQQAEAEK